MASSINASTSNGVITTADTSGVLNIQTANTTAMTIDASQNVGIGTTSPSAPLTVYTSSATTLNIDFKNAKAAGQGDTYLNLYKAANGNSNGMALYTGTTQKWIVGTGITAVDDLFKIYNASTGAAAITIDASNNLGIGTTTPSNRVSIVTASGSDGILSVKSPTTDTAGVVIDGGTDSNKGAVLKFSKNSTVKWQIGTDSAIGGGTTDNLNIYSGGANAMLFSTNAAERVRIDSSGNMGIGTTTLSNGRLSVTQPVGTNVQYFVNSNATTAYGIQIYYSGRSPNSTGEEFIYCGDTAQRFSARSNGGLANYQANNVNLSDRREKTNFAPAGEYLSKICAIPVQTFNYIDQNMEDDPGLTLGVVAQDVQAVAPELVTESNWGTKEEPKMRLSIYQTDLQYALMKCIQEQQAIIEQLKADVAALKGA